MEIWKIITRSERKSHTLNSVSSLIPIFAKPNATVAPRPKHYIASPVPFYNPNWGRFLNADGTIAANEDVISHNLFAYVSNNPVTL